MRAQHEMEKNRRRLGKQLVFVLQAIKNELSGKRLGAAMETAVKQAFLALFANKEQYYYCILLTTGDRACPLISAWSWEALQRESPRLLKANEDLSLVQWSYGDSPYYAFGYEKYFGPVEHILRTEHPSMDSLLDDDAGWDEELNFLLAIMESTMRRLDKQGIFSINQTRDQVIIAVGYMPPDTTNAETALRLNQKSALLESFLEDCCL